jgi:hypothetical protein
VSPTHLGTVTPTGSFVAKASGTGTVTAYSGTASSTTDLTVLCPFTPTAATSGFTVICTASTELHVESGAATATGPLVQVADADVRELEARFGRPFQRRPVVHAFGSTETFTSGLQRVFRMTVNEARRTAEESQALFASNPGYTIGINWQEAGEDSPVTVLRHELTHMMIRQVVGPRTGAVVPTWLNEGMAHTEEFAVAGAEAEAAVHRSGSASMAANNALLTFQQLDGDAWDEATGERAHYQRYAASQAVRFLREDLGDATVVRLFDVMAGGRTFTSAYATVAGKPFSEFAAAYPARVRALSSSYPTVTAVSGVGRLTFVAFGFGPNTAISVSVDGGETKEAKADGYGMYVTFLDSSWPAGSYTITVNAGGEAFTATGAK